MIGVDCHTSFQQIAFFEEETGECGEQQLSYTRKPNASTAVLPTSTNSPIPLSSPPSAPPLTPIPSLSVSSLPAEPQTSAPVPHPSKPGQTIPTSVIALQILNPVYSAPLLATPTAQSTTKHSSSATSLVFTSAFSGYDTRP